VQRTYQRSALLDQRRHALDAWADRVMQLAGGRAIDNIVRLITSNAACRAGAIFFSENASLRKSTISASSRPGRRPKGRNTWTANSLERHF